MMYYWLQPLLIFGLLFSQTMVSPFAGEKPVLLMNATAHLGDGQQIDNAAVAFHNGQITMVADATRIRLDMSAFQVREAFGYHIYAAVVAEKEQLKASRNLFYVSLDSAGLVIDLKGKGLEEGEEATLIVTDHVLKKKSKASVLMTYVKGKQVTPQHTSPTPLK